MKKEEVLSRLKKIITEHLDGKGNNIFGIDNVFSLFFCKKKKNFAE